MHVSLFRLEFIAPDRAAVACCASGWRQLPTRLGSRQTRSKGRRQARGATS